MDTARTPFRAANCRSRVEPTQARSKRFRDAVDRDGGVGDDRLLAGVAEWQTRRIQNPLLDRVGVQVPSGITTPSTDFT